MRSKHCLTGLSRMAALAAAMILVLFSFSCAKTTRARVPPPPRIGTTQEGIASWYGVPYHGRFAANGEVYDMNDLTAAHREWPFDTIVRVFNLSNHRHVEVRITDRGPFVKGRIIDLSQAAAREIDMVGPGTAKVRLRVMRVSTQTPRAAAKDSTTTVPMEPPSPGAKQAPPQGTAKFAVQAAAFRDRSRAEELRARLEIKFGSAHISRKEGDDIVWRVMAGAEATLDGATQLAEKIRLEFPGAFVVRLEERE